MTATEMPLARARAGSLVELTNLHMPTTLRMQELGLRAGAHAAVAARGAFGGVVLNVAGSRLAVDRHSAQLITVRTLGDAA
ncbi:FeoA domain-containing protein [Neoactinobaculum massilliense]|uniref:FeoA domain-containing protein n=1 Tax=Neoactinobaculum massilliense TaxID=2364794 RepID=UPI001F14EB96|nr:FeoA domain-containing protein [Neoactinobaculum massilliense]